jgi:hypothetical protein
MVAAMKSEQPPSLTQLEMSEAEVSLCEEAAKRLGYEQTAYTSSSMIWGLYCLPENPKFRNKPHRGGVFMKTAELGILFVAGLDDLQFHDLKIEEVKVGA